MTDYRENDDDDDDWKLQEAVNFHIRSNKNYINK